MMAKRGDTGHYPPVNECPDGGVHLCASHHDTVRDIFGAINTRMSRGQVLWSLGVFMAVAAFLGICMYNTFTTRQEAAENRTLLLEREAARVFAESEKKVLLLAQELGNIKEKLDKLDKGQDEMRREMAAKFEALQREIRNNHK